MSDGDDEFWTELTMPEGCLCDLSPRLCPEHGQSMTDEIRRAEFSIAIRRQWELDFCAIGETMDQQYEARLVDFLRSDIALGYELREFLADALEGKGTHWKLTWSSAKSGPANTPERVKRRGQKLVSLVNAAEKALRAVRSGEKVEAAIASIMKSESVSRATAYKEYKMAKQYAEQAEAMRFQEG